MFEPLPNYDNWKLATPDYYEDTCDTCDYTDDCPYDHDINRCEDDDEGDVDE